MKSLIWTSSLLMIFAVNAHAVMLRSQPVTISIAVRPPPPPTGSGWTQLANTKLSSVCAPDPSPNHGTNFNCTGIVLGWGGAAVDTKRNRLVLMGGGHGDYDGNELYALDLNQNKMIRLNDPTPLPTGASNTGVYSDGRPASRHSYGGLTYVEHNDKMSMFGGSIAYNGNLIADLWTLDFAKFYVSPNAASPWLKLRDNMGLGNNAIPFSAYDPVSKLVYLIDSAYGTFSFNSDTNQVQILNSNSETGNDYHYTMTVDPVNRYVYAFGSNTIKRMSIAAGTNYKWTEISGLLGACSALNTVGSPGITFDSKNKKIIGWKGGANVYVIDPVTLGCTVRTFGGTPPGKALDQGTFNRFAYFPALNAFALVNDPYQDAYLLKME